MRHRSRFRDRMDIAVPVINTVFGASLITKRISYSDNPGPKRLLWPSAKQMPLTASVFGSCRLFPSLRQRTICRGPLKAYSGNQKVQAADPHRHHEM